MSELTEALLEALKDIYIYINKNIKSDQKNKIFLNKEPYFIGDINDCELIILNLNPGISKDLKQGQKQDGTILNTDIDNYPDYLVEYKKEFLKNGKIISFPEMLERHDGWDEWWRKHLIQYLPKEGDKEFISLEKIVLIEYYPFSTENAKVIPKEITEDFKNVAKRWIDFLKEKMEIAKEKEKKIPIIIGKGSSVWEDFLKDDIHYPDELIYSLNNPQNGHFSPKIIVQKVGGIKGILEKHKSINKT